MKLVAITSGEPNGIGPDICMKLAEISLKDPLQNQFFVLGDPQILADRASRLKKKIAIRLLSKAEVQKGSFTNQLGELAILPVYAENWSFSSLPHEKNAPYVFEQLDLALDLARNYHFNLLTAPVNKKVLAAMRPFKGHTEYFGDFFKSSTVMMLVNQKLKVALLTTHIPLKDVSAAIDKQSLSDCLRLINQSFRQLGYPKARIGVCGLNPHAGENGLLGQEENQVIIPVLTQMQQEGLDVKGPYSADSIFLQGENFDVILALYHDQGLPTLKYADFKSTVNVTLGLPILRTSVGHGTASNLVATGLAKADSLLTALDFSFQHGVSRT